MVVADIMVSTVAMEKGSSIAEDDGQFLLTPLHDGKKKKKRSSCHETKCELVDYHSLPSFLKHNEFILNYYRSEWPLKQTILSIFSIHNETINVWTHLIGFFLFFSLTACTVMMVPMDATVSSPVPLPLANLPSTTNVSDPLNPRHHGLVAMASPQGNLTDKIETDPARGITTRWPFYAYLCGAMFCLIMSSACHLLSCHSEHTCYVMLRLDYGGISALIVTSFYPLVYYSFMCDPFFQSLYLCFITAFGIATVLVSLVPVFETPEFRSVRAGLFVCMGLSGLVPIVHKVMMFGHRPEAVLTTGYEMVMGTFYVLGVLVYAARIPERWMPGKFDLAGHSHQLFHVLVIAGAYTHYLAGLVYLRWRDLEAC
ncbi:heptahelical transmembrane protein 4-like [Phoenix dactylifera]|uniref:Heptahelical transmembrane protein 4-like n=1 Tax=Phoenix dactylifera TaxID=42345 RepID=A0A8B7CB99_PHODC|nr:heptahelical transmembrane protein 4-like [Phoenix dactylifera]